MAENTTSISLSIPHDLVEFLDNEAIRCNTKKSSIIQEELYNRMRRVKTEGRNLMFFPFILLSSGILMMGLSIFLIPVFFNGFIMLGVLGLASLFTGYLGVYTTFKQRGKTYKNIDVKDVKSQ